MSTAPSLLSRTGSADFPTYLKCMISGPPKSGKTTLLGTVPNIIVLDTEPHANNLQSIAHLNLPFKSIHSTDDLRQVQFVLSNDELRQQTAQALGIPKIEAVAIDTLDTLQSIMKRERLRHTRKDQFLRDDWGWIKEEMTAILESFLSLPMHVFFVVHTKTKEIGPEGNQKTVILPGLEGSIAESIAGMVGYSLLSFRKEEISPEGRKYTKYWLRAEGDETYEFLGNRAAGRLPDVIEPDFKTLLDAAMAGRPTQEPQQPQVQVPQFQTTSQLQSAPQQAAPPAPPAQNQGQPTGVPQNQSSDEEPVNSTALQHVKKVYDAAELAFPEEKLKKVLNMGQARTLVRMYRAALQDHAEGKGGDPKALITEYITGQGWVADEAPAQPAPTPVEPKVDGTIEQVKAYATDLDKVNEAYQLEINAAKPRSSLLDWLVAQGATVGTPVQTEAPEAPSEPVTPDAATADETPTEEQAVETVKEALGGEVISQEINQDAPCQECGNPIDDVDLAEVGKARFGRVLCVSDYIAETKKPRG